MASSKGGLNLPIKVNDQEVKKSFKEINGEYSRLRNSVNKLEEGTDEWTEANKRLAKVEAERKGMIERQKAFREEVAKTTKTTEEQTSAMQEFASSGSQAFSSLMSGDIVGFQEGMKGVTAGIKSATRAGLAFIATPIGATIAALAGIALAAREWANYNKEAAEANMITQQITRLQGELLDQARLRAQVMEETFGTDFKDNLAVATSLVKAFDISYNEAFDRIEDGLIRGGQQNDEFMKSFREYPKLFAQAGFTVEDFQRIVNTGIDMSIYDDKLPDAIKEFSLSMMEGTTTARDAMLNAFGKEFTDEIFNNIKNGSITSKDALKLISAEAERIGLNAQQSQQLTADLFRGAGEDAGGALVIFEAMNVALNDQQRELTDLEQLLKNTADANNELAAAQDRALKSDAYAKMSNDASLAWTKIKTAFYDGLSYVTDQLDRLLQFQTRVFTQVTAVVTAMPTVISKGLVNVQKEVLDVIVSFGKLGGVVEKLLQWDFSGAKEAAIDFKNSFAKEAGDVTQSAENIVKTLKNISDAAGSMVDDNFAKARSAAGEAANIETPAGAPKFTNTNPNGLPDADTEKAEKDAAKAAELAAKKAAKAEEDQKKAEEKELQRIRDFEDRKRAVEDELELAKAETDEEKERLKAEQKYEKEMLTLQRDLENLKLNTEEYQELERLLTEQHQGVLEDIRNKSNEKQLKSDKELYETRQKLVNDSLDAVIAAAGQESKTGQAMIIIKRALALKETAIQLGLFQNKMALNVGSASGDIAAGTAKTAAVGFPQNIPLLIGFGIQVAGIIGAIRQAAKSKNEVKNSFWRGGFTDLFGMGYKDSTGHEVAGDVHVGEYVVPKVVRQDPEVPAILDYLENKRKRKLGLYADGGEVGTDTVSSGGATLGSPFISNRAERLLEDILVAVSANRDILFGSEAELKRQELQKKLDNLKTRSKVKK